MARLRVAMVSDDQQVLMAAAKAFDNAPSDWSMFLGPTAPENSDVVVSQAGDPIPGGIEFDPDHPGDLIQRIRRFASAQRDVFIVTSACGGCGVTSVALHLAATLARRAKSGTFVVESDQSRGLIERAGLERDGLPTWEGIEATDDAMTRVVTIPGDLRLLAAPPCGGPCADAIESCRQRGVTVVDAGPEVLIENEPSSPAILVLPPTVPGAIRTRNLVDLHPHLTWATVSNRLGRGGETDRSKLSALLGSAPTVELPCTPALRDAEDLGRLLGESWTRFARRIDLLARALVT